MKKIGIRSSLFHILTIILFIVTIVLLNACRTTLPASTLSPVPTSTYTPRPTLQSTSTVTPTPAPPEHRIGIRVENGVAEFYDRLTGQTFIPRGNNYIRLSNRNQCLNAGTFYHSNFAPGEYDAQQAARALARMKESGYNTVRIFIDEWCDVNTSGRLSSDYMKNVADFLRQAKEDKIFVFLTNSFPPVPGYAERIPFYEAVEWPNTVFFTTEGIDVGIQFWQDFIRELVNLEAPLDYVLAYSLHNEMFFFGDIPPLTLTAGQLSTANGQTYDLADPDEKQRMMDESLVYWIDRMRAGILEVDPTALVTVGFFEPQAPNPARIGDTRLIRTYPAIWESSADFIDLHAYSGVNLTLPQYMENYELGEFDQKPVIMGEFGAFKSAYPSSGQAARALQNWQVESCEYGFDGWLLWTWDSEEQPELWNGLSGDAVIDQALSPASRPNPCVPGPFTGQNVASGKPARASRSLHFNPPELAIDESFDNWWGSGAMAPQWIEIDLQAPYAISQIRLAISQSPDGETFHRIRGRSPTGNFRVLYEFSGFTYDGQILEYSPDEPWEDIQFIRIETLASPSWVSWREIEVVE